jgi:hypothetical protein
MLEQIIEVRSKDPVKDWKPTYLFVLAWDRLAGVGIGEDYDASDRLKMILQKGAGLDFLVCICLQGSPSCSTACFRFLTTNPKR